MVRPVGLRPSVEKSVGGQDRDRGGESGNRDGRETSSTSRRTNPARYGPGEGVVTRPLWYPGRQRGTTPGIRHGVPSSWCFLRRPSKRIHPTPTRDVVQLPLTTSLRPDPARDPILLRSFKTTNPSTSGVERGGGPRTSTISPSVCTTSVVLSRW